MSSLCACLPAGWPAEMIAKYRPAGFCRFTKSLPSMLTPKPRLCYDLQHSRELQSEAAIGGWRFGIGFRFRKTVRLGRLARLNFSGSGVSLGLGPRGANINISRRGLRKTVGIPGSGLSYQTLTRWPDTRPPAAAPSTGGQGTLASGVVEQGRKGSGFVKFLVAMAVLFIVYSLFSSPRPTPSAPHVALSPVTAPGPGPTTPASATAVSKAPDNTQQAIPRVAGQPEPPAAVAAGPLTVDEIREVQTWLKAFGLDPAPVDGLMGPLTTAAIKKYEAARLRPVTGNADRQMLERLRKDTGGAVR